MFEWIKYGLLVLVGAAVLAFGILTAFGKKDFGKFQYINLGLSFVYGLLCLSFANILNVCGELLGVKTIGFKGLLKVSTEAKIIIIACGVLSALFIAVSVLNYLKLWKRNSAFTGGKLWTTVTCFALALFGCLYATGTWHYSGTSGKEEKLIFSLALDRLGPVRFKNFYNTLFKYGKNLPEGDTIMMFIFGVAFFVLFALFIVRIAQGSYSAITMANILVLYTIAITAVAIMTPIAFGSKISATPAPFIAIAFTLAIRVIVALHFGEKFRFSMIIKNQLV